MDDIKMKGQVIVITGASSGFGRGAALRFARAGASVVLAARRDQVLDDVADECEKLGGSALVMPTDVSVQTDVEALAQSTVAQLGRIDVWVNNAGAGAVGPFFEIPLMAHVRVIDVDLMGTLYGSYYAMQQFREQGEGTLINVASIVGKLPLPYYSSYVAAKHGVVGLSASIRQELKASGIPNIHVCTVLPAAFDTPFFQHAANFSGHQFEPEPPVYDPKEVVETIFKLVKDPEDEVTVGTAATLGALTHNVAPGLTESKKAKDTHEALMEKAPPAPETEGSLMEPEPVGAGVTGGWRRKKN